MPVLCWFWAHFRPPATVRSRHSATWGSTMRPMQHLRHRHTCHDTNHPYYNHTILCWSPFKMYTPVRCLASACSEVSNSRQRIQCLTSLSHSAQYVRHRASRDGSRTNLTNAACLWTSLRAFRRTGALSPFRIDISQHSLVFFPSGHFLSSLLRFSHVSQKSSANVIWQPSVIQSAMNTS